MTHRVRSRCRAEGCRSKGVMIALVDEPEIRPGEGKARYGVCLCRPHGLMWLQYRFAKFKLKPHKPPVADRERKRAEGAS